MSQNYIDIRKQTYFKLSSQIAQLDNIQLRYLFDDSELNTSWGINHTIDIEPYKIFVKRVPITSVEYDNLFSTSNFYDLPTYYNFGVGSAGFGVFRELITHIKTTNWVLAETIGTFPLMYHYRIMPFSGQRADVDMDRHKRYVKYWGNNKNIGNYLLDRANANYELVLFLEYIPYVLDTWLRENPNKLQQPLDDLSKTIDFLQTQGIIHFDAHFHNILTDGEQTYLTDFGLALDRSFTLTQEESSFFARHTLYDYGEVLWNLGDLIRSPYDSCSDIERCKIDEKYDIRVGLSKQQLRSKLIENIEQIHTDKDLVLNEFYVANIVKNRNIITLMQDFYSELRGNDQKDTQFPHTKLRQLLQSDL